MTAINRTPSRKDLRLFGLLLPVFFGALGLIVGRRTGSAFAARAVWSLGLAACLSYWAIPSLRRPVFVGWSYATYPFGWAVSHLVLAVVYFGVVTPIGVLARLFRQDPMHRRFDPAAPTYWVTRPPDADIRRYFRQF